MAGANEGTIAQSRKRTFVALTDQPSVREKAVLIANCVSERALARSGLLSGLESTEGLASLPSNISPAEVRLWETAYLTLSEIPLDELVTVLKVSDALGDANIAKWQEDVTKRVLSTDWQDAVMSASTQCILFRLPPHLLRRVIASCHQNSTLTHLLTNFPPPLHPALVEAAAADGALKLSFDSASPALAVLLTSAVASRTLQRLEIHGSTADALPTATAALLGHALSSHPSLTSLTLAGEFLPPQWLRAFTDCLSPGALPALASLALFAESSPACCAELAVCLSRLPALTSFDIEVKQRQEPAAESTVVSLAAYTPLAAAPACLPHLQRLAVTEKRSDRPRVLPWDGFIPSFLSLVRTPALTDLIMRCTADGLAPQHFLDIVSQISNYEHLQSIDIAADLTARLSSVQASGGSSSAPPALPASLSSVTVDSTSGQSAVEMTAAFARSAAASLTAIVLSGCAFDMYEGAVPATAVVWEAQLSPALARCTGLKDLDLTCVGCSHETQARFSTVLAATLEPLQQLTRLRLGPTDDDFGFPLQGQVLGEALSKLTALEVLQFDVSDSYGLTSDQGKAELDSAQPVLNACAQLTRLRKLQLCFTGFAVAEVADLLQNLPSLTHLGLCRSEFGEQDDDGELKSRFSNVSVHLH